MTILTLPIWVVIAGITCGIIVGALVNVIVTWDPGWFFEIIRLWSRCKSCHKRIPWYDNIPILSWLVQGGRRHCCGSSIPLRYLIVEILCGVLAFCLLVAPPSGKAVYNGAISTMGIIAFMFELSFLAILLMASLTNFETTEINYETMEMREGGVPQYLTDAGTVLGCVGSLLVPGLAGRLYLPGVYTNVDSLLSSLVGIVAGVGVSELTRLLGTVAFGKEALGFGIVTMMGVVGAFLGWKKCLVAYFVAPFVGFLEVPIQWMLKAPWKYGSSQRPKEQSIEYTMCVAVGTIAVMFTGDYFLSMIKHTSQMSSVKTLLLGVPCCMLFAWAFYVAIKEHFWDIDVLDKCYSLHRTLSNILRGE